MTKFKYFEKNYNTTIINICYEGIVLRNLCYLKWIAVF